MAELKTRPTGASVTAYLEAIEDESRRSDCKAIAALMARATRARPKMWGTSIVGFGRYRFRYDSGREGDWFTTGFSSRKGDISVYLMAAGPRQKELLARLGRHRMGKSCLYVRRLTDIDIEVLTSLVEDSLAELRRRYGGSGRAPSGTREAT